MQMSELSFAEILNMQAKDIKTPQALPMGTYLSMVMEQPQFAKAGVAETDCVDFSLKPLQAQGDVDPKQLAEVLNGEALSDRRIKHRMFVTDRSKHRLKKFLVDDLGLDENNSVRQLISEAINRQVYVKLTHQPSKDGSAVVYENVASTAKV
jgi:hypothetical protein